MHTAYSWINWFVKNREADVYGVSKQATNYGCPGFLPYIAPYPNYAPAGVDFGGAKKLGRNVIWALSLPGKTAPVTSGEIIKEAIMNILEETEVLKE